MLSLSNKGLRLLTGLLTLSLILGVLAVAGITVYLAVLAVQGDFSLLLVFPEGLQFTQTVRSASLGSFLLYSVLLLATLVLGLLFLYLLRSILHTLSRSKGFTQTLPSKITNMGYILLALAYAKQLLLVFVFTQDLGELSGLLGFRFQLLPNEAVYALILLVLARVFSYAFALQREYEQTV